MIPLTDTDKMPFGKYKGELIQDVPASYLHWLWQDQCYKEIIKVNRISDYIYRNLYSLKKENPDLIWT